MKRVTIVEGRAHGGTSLKGETLQGMTKPMKSTATKLERIAQRSREDAEAEFIGLMPHFNESSLVECFHELDGRKAMGADGQTKAEYGADLLENLAVLLERMKRMAYRPGPVREVLIPKEGKKGATRPLGISNFEDKVVQLMTSKVLEAIYEPIFRDCSYGFRPNRGCHTAIRALHQYLYRNTCEVVIDVDLRNFFGTLNHDVLLDLLRIKIKDNRFIRYIARLLKAGVLRDGELSMTDEGSPQGNVASPILANIYAHYVIDVWFQDVVKQHVEGPVELFRYADDMVICCRFRRDAVKIQRALAGRLEKYSLQLNAEKTKFVSFDRKGFCAGTKQGTFDFLGFTFYLGRSRNNNVVVKVKTSCTRVRSKLQQVKAWVKANRHKEKLKPLWLKFVTKLVGHIRYYGVSFNVRQVGNFLYRAVRIFFKWMNRRSQRRSLTWEQFTTFQQLYPLPPVKVYVPLF